MQSIKIHKIYYKLSGQQHIMLLAIYLGFCEQHIMLYAISLGFCVQHITL